MPCQALAPCFPHCSLPPFRLSPHLAECGRALQLTAAPWQPHSRRACQRCQRCVAACKRASGIARSCGAGALRVNECVGGGGADNVTAHEGG
eukprot:355020-Chlamydomonas_euryale.AAC.3